MRKKSFEFEQSFGTLQTIHIFLVTDIRAVTWLSASCHILLNLIFRHKLQGVKSTHRALAHNGEVATEQLDVAAGVFTGSTVVLWDRCHNPICTWSFNKTKR